MLGDKSAGDNNENLEEWKEARSVIARFDENLHDLRKYGFSFITGLLSAESLLLPSNLFGRADKTVFPDNVKIGVLLVTLILIVSLQLMDRNYLVFQQAASTRARILERTLNLELTEVIALRYESKHIARFVGGIYLAMILAILALGVPILYPNYPYILIFIGIAIVPSFVANRVILKVRYPFGELDWTIDRVECEAGDKVGITLTNMASEDLDIMKDNLDVVWKRTDEDCGEPIIWAVTAQNDRVENPLERKTGPVTIGPNGNYTWLWDTSGRKDGIYQIWRLILNTNKPRFAMLRRKVRQEANLRPLLRKIRVVAAKEPIKTNKGHERAPQTEAKGV